MSINPINTDCSSTFPVKTLCKEDSSLKPAISLFNHYVLNDRLSMGPLISLRDLSFSQARYKCRIWIDPIYFGSSKRPTFDYAHPPAASICYYF